MAKLILKDVMQGKLSQLSQSTINDKEKSLSLKLVMLILNDSWDQRESMNGKEETLIKI